MMLDKDIFEYVQCLVRMAREGDRDAMSEAIKFRDFPIVAELIDERLEAIESGMDQRKAFPSPRKVGFIEKKMRDFAIALSVERAKARGMSEGGAIALVAEAGAYSEGKVKAAHQKHRQVAKQIIGGDAP